MACELSVSSVRRAESDLRRILHARPRCAAARFPYRSTSLAVPDSRTCDTHPARRKCLVRAQYRIFLEFEMAPFCAFLAGRASSQRYWRVFQSVWGAA